MNEIAALDSPDSPSPPQSQESPGAATPISIHTEHGSLHGLLALPADARGLVVLAHAGALPECHDDALAAALREAGMATLVIDLLTHQEERFADVHNNVPLLAKRLLDCLALIKRQMQNGELPLLPIGLCGADSTSPVAIRVAALRDHDIAAVVCRGGLIDLAGMLYLRSLESPLLVLVDDADQRVVASNRRALQEVGSRKELTLVPRSAHDLCAATADSALRWFASHFPPARGGTSNQL